MPILSIDGVVYDVDCAITRTLEMTASEISGLLLNGTIFKDIIGTYLQYDVRFKYPLYNQAKYAAIIEKLSEPVAAHTFILPYNETTVTIVANVETVSDELLELENKRKYWRDTRFTITSIYPTKVKTLGEVIAYGLPPLPSAVSPEVGDTYTWDGTEWEETSTLPDADNISY